MRRDKGEGFGRVGMIRFLQNVVWKRVTRCRMLPLPRRVELRVAGPDASIAFYESLERNTPLSAAFDVLLPPPHANTGRMLRAGCTGVNEIVPYSPLESECLLDPNASCGAHAV